MKQLEKDIKTIAELHEYLIRKALVKFKIKQATKILGISEKTLRTKIKQYNILINE